MEPYVNIAELDHFYDGDTVWLWIDLGYRSWHKEKFRIIGIDTPELRGGSKEEKRYAIHSKLFAEQALKAQPGQKFLVRSAKKTKYDYGIEIFLKCDEEGRAFAAPKSLAEYMIEKGYGVPYAGNKKLLWEERKNIQDSKGIDDDKR